MRIVTLISITLIFTAPIFAQKPEIFGYFEPQIMGVKFENSFYQLASNKLRIDLKYHPSERVSFGANFDYITYHGKTQWDILEYLPESVRNEVPETNFFGIEINPYMLPYEDRTFLDNAWLKLRFKHADVTLGKQQLSFGTGYAWNPLDVFNQKDITDPTYEQPGHNAVRVDLPLQSNWSLTALYAPTANFKDTDLFFRLKGNWLHFDFSLTAIQKQWFYTDARIFDPILMNFYQINTRRHILGGDLVGEILGWGIWTEFAYNQTLLTDTDKNDYFTTIAPYLAVSTKPFLPFEVPQDFYEWVVGMDYTFDFQTYIMFEFFRNSAAKTNSDAYQFNDWMQLLLAETKTISRDQLYIFVRHPATDLINIGCSGIVSLSDESFGVIPMLTWNIFENVDLTFVGNIYLGKSGTAYASNLGNGGICRARVYF